MTAAAHPILAGLEGWHRYGQWAAHFYVDGRHLCNASHGRFLHRFKANEWTPRRPDPAPLTAHGTPFGRVCARCQKLLKETAPPKRSTEP